jgi:hypothetical protein
VDIDILVDCVNEYQDARKRYYQCDCHRHLIGLSEARDTLEATIKAMIVQTVAEAQNGRHS